MDKVKLKTKFAVLLLVLFIVALVGNLFWNMHAQRQQTEAELREKGQVLSQQMAAVWDFMSVNQDRLLETAYAKNGAYQGLHCAIVGRSIGKQFSFESGYETRFVNFDPRNIEDEPDAFEAEALTAFLDDPSLKEYYAITEKDGNKVFRYSAPMKIEKTCLECHGEPAGEIDVTGHPKEGWSIDDIGGAISIAMPMESYLKAEHDLVVRNVSTFVIILVVCLLIIYAALTHLVTRPLQRLRQAFGSIQKGNLDVRLNDSESSYELNAVVAEFNEMAHQLSDLYDNLESQVEERTAQLSRVNEALKAKRVQLERANERLRNENQYKSDFLSMMSHELRTPLTSIIAFSEMLNRAGDPADEKEAEIRREIEANSHVLLLMINDILEMSRLDAGKTQLVMETVDLGDIVGLVLSVVAPLARRNKVGFTYSIDADVPLVTCDGDRIRHVLENLCGNAMKFTPAQGTVALSVSYDAAADEVLMSVSDTGIGIAEEDRERIFEKFVQADSSASRRYRGTGLGLALVREYTEMHGGRVELESELGRGSTFTVHLPVHPAPASDEEGAAGEAGHAGTSPAESEE